MPLFFYFSCKECLTNKKMIVYLVNTMTIIIPTYHTYRRNFVALLCIMFLSMTAAAEGLFAETCCNGQNEQVCLCGNRHETPSEIFISSVNGCCSQTRSTPCHVSRSQSNPTDEFPLLVIRTETRISLQGLAAAEETRIEPPLQYAHTFHQEKGTRVRSVPFYLHHSALLC